MGRFGKILKWVVIGALALAGMVGVGLSAWNQSTLGPASSAQVALTPVPGLDVQKGQWLVFQPDRQDADTGFIFYPGGNIDYRSYAPAAQAIAKEGYLVVIVPMPFNLAVLAPGRAAQVQQAFPQIKHWAIGGHSLGGAMAAQYAGGHLDAIQGLVLWAAYPASNNNLSKSNLKVVSIYASNDGLATPAKIDASRPLLPAGTRWVAIQGGNHAGFGDYGLQQGDGAASITPAEQQAQVVAATVGLLQEIAGPKP
jgi:hypothetical protein